MDIKREIEKKINALEFKAHIRILVITKHILLGKVEGNRQGGRPRRAGCQI